MSSSTLPTKGLQQTAWEARAITLAAEKHLSGTARHIGENTAGGRLWKVRSQSSDSYHVVTFFPATRGIVCDCIAGSYGRPCAHAGAAILAEKQREEAMRPSRHDEAWSWWIHGGAWE